MLEYKSYLATENNFMEVLDKYGVCVIPGIISEDECIKTRNTIWNDLNYISKNRFNIKKIKTWSKFDEFMPLHSMLMQYHSIGHLQSVWNIRQNENIGKIFGKIWNAPEEELLVSFDGIGVHLPPERTGDGWDIGNKWLHTDQSPTKDKIHLYSRDG